MDKSNKKELEKLIREASEGKTNEISPKMDRLVKILKASLQVPEESPVFPDFSDLWEEAGIGDNSQERTPVIQELPRGKSPSLTPTISELQGIPANFSEERNFSPLVMRIAAMLLLGLGIGSWLLLQRMDRSYGGENSSVADNKDASFRWSKIFPGLVTSDQARAIRVRGSVYAIAGDGSQISVEEGQAWGENTRFVVSKGAVLDLGLTEYSSIRIRENSDLTVDRLSRKTNRVELELREGTVLSHVAKLKKDSEFLIRSGAELVQVRGTRFLTRNQSGVITVAVADGRVAVGNASREGQVSSAEPLVEVIASEQITLTRSGSILRSPIDPRSRKEISELDAVPIEEKDGIEVRSLIQTEDDLFQTYSILEEILLDDGARIRGVVYGMDEENLYVRTHQSELKISQKKVIDVEKIR